MSQSSSPPERPRPRPRPEPSLPELSSVSTSVEPARSVSRSSVVVRASYVLGGGGSGVVDNVDEKFRGTQFRAFIPADAFDLRHHDAVFDSRHDRAHPRLADGQPQSEPLGARAENEQVALDQR